MKIIILLIFIAFLYFYNSYSFFDNINEVIDNDYYKVPNFIPKTNNIGDSYNGLPLKIYTSWDSYNLPINMYNNIMLLKSLNPEFDIHIYDENDRREFIKNNFNSEVLDAYDSLIPGAFKADLWRYCIIYKNGGVYIDIKYHTYIPIILLIKERITNFTLALSNYCRDDNIEIQNTFFTSPQNNDLFLNVINNIINNTKTKNYDNTVLHVTGPCIFTKHFFNKYGKDFFKELTLKYQWRPDDNIVSIYLNGTRKLFAESYIEYRNDQSDYYSNNNKENYHDAFALKKVYK